MENIVSWIKNHSQSIYEWVGRVTMFGGIGFLVFITVRWIISQQGYSFDPLLYILILTLILIAYKIWNELTLLRQNVVGLLTKLESTTQSKPTEERNYSNTQIKNKKNKK